MVQILDDLSNFGIKDLLSTYAAINQSKIDLGAAKAASNVAEWTAQSQLLSLQIEAQKAAQNAATVTSDFVGSNKKLIWLGVALVVSVGAILVLKK